MGPAAACRESDDVRATETGTDGGARATVSETDAKIGYDGGAQESGNASQSGVCGCCGHANADDGGPQEIGSASQSVAGCGLASDSPSAGAVPQQSAAAAKSRRTDGHGTHPGCGR